MSDAVHDETVSALERLSSEMDRALEHAKDALARSKSTWAQSAALLAGLGVDVPQPTAWPPATPLAPKQKKRKQRLAI